MITVNKKYNYIGPSIINHLQNMMYMCLID